jgi:hypothetical protein
MLEELVDLSAGLGVMLLPALILAVPGIILFIVLPGLLLLPLAIVAAILIAPPYLLLRWFRRRGDRSKAGPHQREHLARAGRERTSTAAG